MPRVTPVYRPADYPAPVDAQTKADLDTLFAYLRPGVAEPEIDHAHTGVAIAALNPRLALNLAQMSKFVALDMPWTDRADLRELAVQAVNQRYHCTFTLDARRAGAETLGLTPGLLAAIPDWRTSPLFTEEQQQVIDYVYAVTDGPVPADLFARIAGRYGQKAAVELTAAIGWWSLWAMVINAAGAGE